MTDQEKKDRIDLLEGEIIANEDENSWMEIEINRLKKEIKSS